MRIVHDNTEVILIVHDDTAEVYTSEQVKIFSSLEIAKEQLESLGIDCTKIDEEIALTN